MRKVAWIVLLLAGCAQGPDVTVSLYQTRSDVPLDKIEIQVQNNGPNPVTVDRAGLVSTQLAGSPQWERVVTIAAGAAVDLKVQLPPALCTGEVINEVVLTVDGHERTLPADDRLGQLADYRAGQCFRQQVEAAGGFRFTGLAGRLLAFETDLPIGSIGSTTLFIPVDQTADSIRLTPNRCDAHALAEDKQGTFFDVPVTLPDGRTQTHRAGVESQLRGGLYRLYARMCGL